MKIIQISQVPIASYYENLLCYHGIQFAHELVVFFNIRKWCILALYLDIVVSGFIPFAEVRHSLGFRVIFFERQGKKTNTKVHSWLRGFIIDEIRPS